MVTGPKKVNIIPLTKEEIEKKISQYDIYRYYIGDFKTGRPINSPLRPDDNPSFIIRNVNGKLYHKDYGCSETCGNCYDFVMQKYNCDFPSALNIINNDFSLGLGSNENSNENSIEKSSIITWQQPKIEIVLPPFFQVVTRSPTQPELKYWEEYYLGLEDLKAENIYFPKDIYRNRRKLPQSPYLTYCYWYEDEQAWKIYRPHGEIGKKVWYHYRKWDSGIRNNLMENKESLTGYDKAFVATSKKDKMVLKKALQINNIANIQAENLDAIKEEDMFFIKSNTKEQYICGDRDAPGKSFSWILTKEYQFRHINPPETEEKDFAAFGKQKGLNAVKSHFASKNAI